MPKKRTKQQKIRAHYHYALPVARSFSGIGIVKNEPGKEDKIVFNKADDVSTLYAYDPHFTRLDISRTLVVSLIILALQLAIYWWWK